jgi:hypothetical protein
MERHLRVSFLFARSAMKEGAGRSVGAIVQNRLQPAKREEHIVIAASSGF